MVFYVLQCLPVPDGFDTSSLSKKLPLTVSFAKALSSESSCTHYVMPYGQCGGSAGGCYGDQCVVSHTLVISHTNVAAILCSCEQNLSRPCLVLSASFAEVIAVEGLPATGHFPDKGHEVSCGAQKINAGVPYVCPSGVFLTSNKCLKAVHHPHADGNSHWAAMQDAVWSSSCCAPSMKGEAFSCARNSAMLWTCLPDTLITTSSYSATVPKARIPCQLSSCNVCFRAQCYRTRTLQHSYALMGQASEGLSGSSVPQVRM